MHSTINRRAIRRRIRYRIRKKISGTAQRPRIAVYRSLKHIYAQAVDDQAQRTLAQSSSREASLEGPGGNIDAAKKVGETLGKRLKEAGIKTAVFDRGGFLFHGRIKALADAVRSEGVKF